MTITFIPLSGAIGADVHGVDLTGALDAGSILDLVAGRGSRSAVEASAASFAAKAAIQLVKLSQGLPAVLAANLVGQDLIDHDPIDREIGYVPSIASVDVDAVGRFAIDAVNSLVVASDALVPLASGIFATQ